MHEAGGAGYNRAAVKPPDRHLFKPDWTLKNLSSFAQELAMNHLEELVAASTALLDPAKSHNRFANVRHQCGAAGKKKQKAVDINWLSRTKTHAFESLAAGANATIRINDNV